MKNFYGNYKKQTKELKRYDLAKLHIFLPQQSLFTKEDVFYDKS